MRDEACAGPTGLQQRLQGFDRVKVVGQCQAVGSAALKDQPPRRKIVAPCNRRQHALQGAQQQGADALPPAIHCTVPPRYLLVENDDPWKKYGTLLILPLKAPFISTFRVVVPLEFNKG